MRINARLGTVKPDMNELKKLESALKILRSCVQHCPQEITGHAEIAAEELGVVIAKLRVTEAVEA